jgi:hypothetical protein
MARRKQDPECAACGNDVWELPDDDGNRECAVCGAPHPNNARREDDHELDTEAPDPRWDRHRLDYERENWPDIDGETEAGEW